ncbi:hypothetical protein WJX81_003514 [Elliptochloris bilobata]|uniref:DAGKc domain-containing protein n=1 Tax=Elliptochloris bilobata TaxID=381761 RepID=A0AAW1RIX8_9CHLO
MQARRVHGPQSYASSSSTASTSPLSGKGPESPQAASEAGFTAGQLPEAVPFDEILSASARERHCSPCCCASKRTAQLVVHTFRRSRQRRCEWRRLDIVLAAPSAEVAAEWVARINGALRQAHQRPGALLVLVNPFGGARRARRTWQRTAEPILEAAGARSVVVETERAGHARELVEGLSAAELESYDGIVAVGGDGLFQEALNGLLAVRGSGGKAGVAAERMRLGHIPAGSTDAVACSLHGTRCATTAALHIALGDRTALDVMRVDTEDGGHRFAACVGSYGYMGDLMALSERMRWLGPGRYGLAGALTLLRGRAYGAAVSLLPAEPARAGARLECRSPCALCGACGAAPAAAAAEFQARSHRALGEGTWRHVEGRFRSVMVAVSPCRSDMSARGLAPWAHLADGRLTLVLVRECSTLQYLRFLTSIPRHGVEPGRFGFVEVAECTAVQIWPRGHESRWNLDGELLSDNRLTVRVHRGLVSVFARGVE